MKELSGLLLENVEDIIAFKMKTVCFTTAGQVCFSLLLAAGAMLLPLFIHSLARSTTAALSVQLSREQGQSLNAAYKHLWVIALHLPLNKMQI